MSAPHLHSADTADTPAPDSLYAWGRLAAALALATLGGVGLWSTNVVLPEIEAEFGVDRSEISLAYTFTMLGFAVGGVMMGRLADRFGVVPPLAIGAVMLGVGYILASMVTSYWQFLLVQGLMIGALGSSASFGPLVADISHWFLRRRGIAVAIVAAGNYTAGAMWSPLLRLGIDLGGWRDAYLGAGIACLVLMPPLILLLRRRPVIDSGLEPVSLKAFRGPALAGGRKVAMQWLLVLAGISCCVAMSMPQVHIVAYCADLGYGAARGAEMLTLMLGLGVVSRLASGVIADRIGGVGTLILGSTLQCIALAFYLPFDSVGSLYVVSALFGLAQGGIVPSYALIVREYFPAREAGARVSLVLMSTIVGMAFGGWMSGEIYDYSGSYLAAFLNGIAWNLLNMAIAFYFLLGRMKPRAGVPQPA